MWIQDNRNGSGTAYLSWFKGMGRVGTTMSPIIEVKDLTKRFGSLEAVHGISFEVDQGEVFGLLGPNGAGKTTTLSMLSTILTITSGTAIVNGFDVAKQPSQVRRSIGIVFQSQVSTIGSRAERTSRCTLTCMRFLGVKRGNASTSS